MAAGLTENMAIRSLELLADVYAKLRSGGSASPHHVSQYELWSLKARAAQQAAPDLRPKDYLRVEHGTPRRAFARMVLDLSQAGKLDEVSMDDLVRRHWKIAVLTLQEDQALNRIARSRAFSTPDERWAAAGIQFEHPSTPEVERP